MSANQAVIDRQSYRIENRSQAIDLIEAFLASRDETLLEPYVLAAQTQSDKNAMSIMAVAGERPGIFVQFISMITEQGLIDDETAARIFVKKAQTFSAA